MIEAVYRKLALTFFVFALLCVTLFFIVIFILLFSQSQNYAFYYGFVALLGIAMFLGAKIAWDYRVISQCSWIDKTEDAPRDLDRCVDVAIKYAFGSSYDDIKKQYGYNDNKQVQRSIRAGIKELHKRGKTLSV